MNGARFAAVLVALSTVIACDERNRSPGAPSPPRPPAQITVLSMAPAPGATLPVRECSYYPSSLSLEFWEMCAEQVKMAFEVTFETDVSDAVVTAGFYKGSQRCGLATSSQTVLLRAGSRAVFEAQVILLSTETVQLPCPLPAATTRMVAQLWERSKPATPLLTREFVHDYTFAAP